MDTLKEIKDKVASLEKQLSSSLKEKAVITEVDEVKEKVYLVETVNFFQYNHLNFKVEQNVNITVYDKLSLTYNGLYSFDNTKTYFTFVLNLLMSPKYGIFIVSCMFYSSSNSVFVNKTILNLLSKDTKYSEKDYHIKVKFNMISPNLEKIYHDYYKGGNAVTNV